MVRLTVGRATSYPDRAYLARAPQQNAYVERYNRTVRYDWLAPTLFDSINQVQGAATQWVWIYNHERPNTAIDGTVSLPQVWTSITRNFGELSLVPLPVLDGG